MIGKIILIGFIVLVVVSLVRVVRNILNTQSVEIPEQVFILGKSREPSNIENRLVELINNYRVENNLNILTYNKLHYDIARTRNLRHIHNGEISHKWLFFDAKFIINRNPEDISENLSEGFTYAKSVFNAWINSEGHRLNMLSEATQIGVAMDKEDKVYYTLILE